MKKLIILTIFFLSFASLMSFSAGKTSAVNVLGGVCSNSSAAKNASVCTSSNNPNPQTPNPIILNIKKAINILSAIIGIVSVVVIILSGLRMVLGGGDPQTINSSRDAIIYAAVGIAVAVVSQAIVVFVLNKIK